MSSLVLPYRSHAPLKASKQLALRQNLFPALIQPVVCSLIDTTGWEFSTFRHCTILFSHFGPDFEFSAKWFEQLKVSDISLFGFCTKFVTDIYLDNSALLIQI